MLAGEAPGLRPRAGPEADRGPDAWFTTPVPSRTQRRTSCPPAPSAAWSATPRAGWRRRPPPPGCSASCLGRVGDAHHRGRGLGRRPCGGVVHRLGRVFHPHRGRRPDRPPGAVRRREPAGRGQAAIDGVGARRRRRPDRGGGRRRGGRPVQLPGDELGDPERGRLDRRGGVKPSRRFGVRPASLPNPRPSSKELPLGRDPRPFPCAKPRRPRPSNLSGLTRGQLAPP